LLRESEAIKRKTEPYLALKKSPEKSPKAEELQSSTVKKEKPQNATPKVI